MSFDELVEIYKKAFEIVKKNKILWIFGLILAVFTGGGSNFNFRFSGDLFDLINPSKHSSSTSALSTINPLFEYFKNLFLSIPIYHYAPLIIGIIIAIVLGIVYSVIVNSWARGAAIGAINDAYDQKQVTLREGSVHGLKNLKNMVWLSVVPYLLYVIVLAISIVISILLIAVGGEIIILRIIGGLLIAIVIFFAVVAGLGISASQIWAQRVVILEGKSGKEAFFEGFRIFKTHIVKMIVLGCSNCLLSCCLGVVIFAGIFGVIFGVIISSAGIMMVNKQIGFIFLGSMLIIIAAIAIVVLLASTLIGGIYKIFNYSTWNILYRKIREAKNG